MFTTILIGKRGWALNIIDDYFARDEYKLYGLNIDTYIMAIGNCFEGDVEYGAPVIATQIGYNNGIGINYNTYMKQK